MSASLAGRSDYLQMVAAAATQPGYAQQTGCGAGVADANLSAVVAGATLFEKLSGLWVMPKVTAINLLDGGRAFLQHSTGLVNFRRVADQDFYLGRVVGDVAAGVATCTVNLNVDPKYDFTLDADPFRSVIIGTQALGGFLPPQRRGQATKLVLSATNEAQKVDALGKDGWAVAANSIIEAGIEVISAGAGSSPVFCFGLASGTHATAVTSIANYLVCRLDGNSTKIQFESGDGTHTVAETDSTKTFTAGTRFEIWIDTRNPANVGLYVDAIQVLSSTVFNISSAANTLMLLAHLVKTATTDTFDVDIDWLRGRLSEQ